MRRSQIVCREERRRSARPFYIDADRLDKMLSSILPLFRHWSLVSWIYLWFSFCCSSGESLRNAGPHPSTPLRRAGCAVTVAQPGCRSWNCEISFHCAPTACAIAGTCSVFRTKSAHNFSANSSRLLSVSFISHSNWSQISMPLTRAFWRTTCQHFFPRRLSTALAPAAFQMPAVRAGCELSAICLTAMLGTLWRRAQRRGVLEFARLSDAGFDSGCRGKQEV